MKKSKNLFHGERLLKGRISRLSTILIVLIFISQLCQFVQFKCQIIGQYYVNNY
jgi:hypothetical protein